MQIQGLLEGHGASEDHESVLAFLRATGLPEGTVKRVHEAIMLGGDNSAKNDREKVLLQMLLPITWSLGSSITYRKNEVQRRRSEVRLVYPFLNAREKADADNWLGKEQHSGLWD